MSHRAKIYHSLDQLIKERSTGTVNSKRFWTIKWKRHIEKKGNVPLIIKCGICSGKERLHDIKNGNFKVSTRVSSRQKDVFFKVDGEPLVFSEEEKAIDYLNLNFEKEDIDPEYYRVRKKRTNTSEIIEDRESENSDHSDMSCGVHVRNYWE